MRIKLQVASAAPEGAACLVQSSDAPGTPGPVFCVVCEVQIFSIAQRRSPSLKLGAPPEKSAALLGSPRAELLAKAQSTAGELGGFLRSSGAELLAKARSTAGEIWPAASRGELRGVATR